MTTELNWNKINIDNSRVKNKKPKDGDEKRKKLVYISLGNKAVGKTYIVRPVHRAVGFYKALIKTPDGRFNNVVIPMDEDGGDSHVRNHPLYVNHNVPFQAKYAVNVIDREDNQLKILEGGISVFDAFSKYHEMTEKSPGAKNGADFKIEVTGQKGKDYYKVNKHQSTVLSDDELKFLKEEGLFDLQSIYKETPEDKWKEWVSQLDGSDQESKPKQESRQEARPKQETVVSKSNNEITDEELFDLDSELDADEIPFA